MKIVVASTNPVKIQAALNGFGQMFPAEQYEVQGIAVPSGVSDQPMSVEETLSGALNRLQNARLALPDADYWVGMEGGVEHKHDALWVFAWIVVRSANGVTGKAQTGVFPLPQEVAQLVHQGVELGYADDQVFGRSNSKQGQGSVGILTHNVIDRLRYYEHAMIMALIPFKNPHLTFGGHHE